MRFSFNGFGFGQETFLCNIRIEDVSNDRIIYNNNIEGGEIQIKMQFIKLLEQVKDIGIKYRARLTIKYQEWYQYEQKMLDLEDYIEIEN